MTRPSTITWVARNRNPWNLEQSYEEERARIAAVEADVARDLRIMRWQSRIAVSSVVLAVATACYFAVEYLR